MPIKPISLLEVALSLAMPTSCIKLAVASLLRSCTINLSLAGIFERRFLAIGYPEKGTQPFVSRIHSSTGGRCRGHGGASTRDKEAWSSPIRPRPMNPHVARFEDVEANERLLMEDIEDVERLLLNMQRREGRDRIETVALMLALLERVQSDGADEEGSVIVSCEGRGNIY